MDSSDTVERSNPTEYIPPHPPINNHSTQGQAEVTLEESSNTVDSTFDNSQNNEDVEQNISQIYSYKEANKTTMDSTKSYQFNHQTEQQLSLEEARQAHFESILAKHPDAMNVVVRPSFETWLNKQPGYIKESYEYTLDRGNSSQVIEMLDHYKRDTGY